MAGLEVAAPPLKPLCGCQEVLVKNRRCEQKEVGILHAAAEAAGLYLSGLPAGPEAFIADGSPLCQPCSFFDGAVL